MATRDLKDDVCVVAAGAHFDRSRIAHIEGSDRMVDALAVAHGRVKVGQQVIHIILLECVVRSLRPLENMVVDRHGAFGCSSLYLFDVGGGTWLQTNLCRGPNDYLITD